MLEAFKHVFPIVASDKAGDVTVVAGTAFSIGDGRFMTAGHCVVTAFEKKWTAIGIPGEKAWEFFEFTSAEYDDDYDVGFFQAKLTKCETLKWTRDQVHMAEQVCSVGYPYAFDSESRTIGIRTFCGSVVAARKFHGLPAKPSIYELSFPCPRGLSGAPLFTPTGTPLVAGVVIGNSSMEMEVYSSKEVLEKDGKAEIYTRYEALQLGVAIRSTSILDVKGPKILGGTLGEHLTKHGLI